MKWLKKDKKLRIKLLKEPLEFRDNVAYCSKCNVAIVKVTEHDKASIFFCDICGNWFKVEESEKQGEGGE
ncbi:MAG: hypothetical protein ACPLKS_07625 [Caldisericum exile]|uniref:hypothetical protein n=1 Tax=Caldisericum exile TaxID=693075 RepID=UPI003C765585